MKDVIFSLLHEHLYLHVLLISICVAGMLVAMGMDLIFGVRKAKALGQVTTSTGYKKTAEKGKKYFMPFAVLMMIDIIGCIILPAPFFAMIWAAWCIFCEFKSVREKAWTKAELRKAERTMSIIIENKDDIARIFSDMIFNSDTPPQLKNCLPASGAPSPQEENCLPVSDSGSSGSGRSEDSC